MHQPYLLSLTVKDNVLVFIFEPAMLTTFSNKNYVCRSNILFNEFSEVNLYYIFNKLTNKTNTWLILSPSSWSFPTKSNTLNNLHSSPVFVFSMPAPFEWCPSFAFISDLCMGFEASFEDWRSSEMYILCYFLMCGHSHRALLISLPLLFTWPHPTAILAFSSPKSQSHAHT